MDHRRRTRRAFTPVAVLLGSLAAPAAFAEPVALDPLLPGRYAAGRGVDATFLKVADGWHGSSVLWDDSTRQYGSGSAIGGYGWGTGLWGLADWRTAHQDPAPEMVEAIWSGRVAKIAFADDAYNAAYSNAWGAVDLAPLFTSGSPPSSQDNWTTRIGGYIRIAEAGAYNFSVLHDDGFFLTIEGGDDRSMTLLRDHLNPRDRLGFDSDLLLDPGLYRFELGAFDRLETGVVQLDWSRSGGDWSPVPTSALVAPPDVRQAAVPEPASSVLAAVGLLAMAGLGRLGSKATAGRRSGSGHRSPAGATR